MSDWSDSSDLSDQSDLSDFDVYPCAIHLLLYSSLLKKLLLLPVDEAPEQVYRLIYQRYAKVAILFGIQPVCES